ncbi:MAG TPA: sigma-70 family RNA polymerase sigma factor [Acidimicrobiales bacterium]|nr:sigma-70 family RNA polymerase sigma factor [Acidimicrobiales bacterium]
MVLAPNQFEKTEDGYDLRLVEAHQAGDPDAFAAIVRDHYPMLLAQAQRRLTSREEAEDAVQEALLRAFRAFSRFGGEYRVGPWLSRILANVCSDAGSRRSALLKLNDRIAGTLDRPMDDTQGLSDPVVLQAISDAVEELPVSQRDAFVLREVDDCSYEELADRMGISEDNARARVHRARSSLQQALSSSREALAAGFGIPAAIHVGFRKVFSNGNSVTQQTTSVVAPSVTTPASALSSVVSQITTTPIGQAIIAVAPSMPKSSVIIGVAASIASVTGLVAGSSPLPAAASNHAAQAVAAVSTVSTLIAPSPVVTTTTTAPPAAVTPTPALPKTPTAIATTPSWISGGASSAVVAPPTAAPAYCAAVNAINTGSGDSAPSFATPAPFAGQASTILNMNTVDLTATGTSQNFGTSATYASSDGTTTAPVNAQVGTCLTSTNGALLVDLTDGAGDQVQLTGGYVETIGDTTDQGYLFRGTATITKNVGGTDAPFGATTQFVAQVAVAQPDNTATLTIAFISADPSASSTAGTDSTPGTDGSTSPTTSDPSSGTASSTDPATTGTSTSDAPPTEGNSLVVAPPGDTAPGTASTSPSS